MSHLPTLAAPTPCEGVSPFCTGVAYEPRTDPTVRPVDFTRTRTVCPTCYESLDAIAVDSLIKSYED